MAEFLIIVDLLSTKCNVRRATKYEEASVQYSLRRSKQAKNTVLAALTKAKTRAMSLRQ